ncbi:DUF4227 family protein [Paenibacillus koleovorans]|uniref:DUF4227 family protein n=1 Tax=Paenibacillus koleovorans TaxID=121608 RepID=UPI000FD72343|nr:DUF4227 family protein [Paenibacillus koleovorans]
MIFSVRRWLIRAKFLFLFVVLTISVYWLFQWIAGWTEPTQRYREPHGRAVKAFEHEQQVISEKGTLADRLLFFYWYGE